MTYDVFGGTLSLTQSINRWGTGISVPETAVLAPVSKDTKCCFLVWESRVIYFTSVQQNTVDQHTTMYIIFCHRLTGCLLILTVN